jgi:hypothetical protein
VKARALGPQPDDQGLSDLAKIQKDLLWGEYVELRTHARHAEMVRVNAVNFVLLLTSALVAVITLDKTIGHADLALCLIIAAIGFFSIGFSLLYLDRYTRHITTAIHVREELDRLFFAKEGLDGASRNFTVSRKPRVARHARALLGAPTAGRCD